MFSTSDMSPLLSRGASWLREPKSAPPAGGRPVTTRIIALTIRETASPPRIRRSGEPHPPTFGELLRRHRVAAGLSQEALAERTGLSVDAIGLLERGGAAAPTAAYAGRAGGYAGARRRGAGALPGGRAGAGATRRASAGRPAAVGADA